MFRTIKNHWYIRGRKIQSIRRSQSRKVSKEKDLEKKRAIEDCKKEFSYEIKRRDEVINELRNLLKREQTRHIKEEERIQKNADKRVAQKITQLNKEQEKINIDKFSFEEERDEARADINFLKTELSNSIAEAKTALAIYQQQARFSRQVAGVTSGLSDSLENQVNRLEEVDKLMNTTAGQKELRKLTRKK